MVLKYIHPKDAEIDAMLDHVGVPLDPAALYSSVKTTYRGRQTQKKLAIKGACRAVIAAASGSHFLSAPLVTIFDKIPTDKIMEELQKFIKWDAPVDVLEYKALCGKGEDPLASEFFIDLVENWAKVFPKLYPTVFGGMKCPPLEMFVLLLRWVRSFCIHA